MADAPAQVPSPAAAALLVRFDLEHPPPVKRMHWTLEEDAIKSGKTKRVHWAQQRRRIRSSR